MKNLFEKLEAIKNKTKELPDEAIIQIKVSNTLKDELSKKLESEGLTYKDLLQSAIEVYLGK